MRNPYLTFDGPAPWGDPVNVDRGYDLEVFPGDDGWLPHIEIEPHVSEHDMTYHFVRHFDKVGVYTPAYVIPDPAFGLFSIPEDAPVPTWMPVAIERAGFGYDPVPNSERHDTPEPTPHPDQTELVDV